MNFLNHKGPMFRLYRNQSITYMANQLTRSYMMETLVLNGLKMRMTSQIARKCKKNNVRPYVLLENSFYSARSALLNNIKKMDTTILNKSESVETLILLYGDESFKDEVNLLILNATIDFVLSASRFDEPLYLI